MKSLEEFAMWLGEEKEKEHEKLTETNRLAHNSFGHGYSSGRIDLINTALDFLFERGEFEV